MFVSSGSNFCAAVALTRIAWPLTLIVSSTSVPVVLMSSDALAPPWTKLPGDANANLPRKTPAMPDCLMMSPPEASERSMWPYWALQAASR